VEHGKNTDDDKMMKVYDEVWHIVQTSAPCSRQSGKKQCEVFWELLASWRMCHDRQTVHAQTSTRGSATEDHRGPTQGYTLGIARRIKRRHVGILHQNLADAGIVCNKSQRDKNPSYLDFHEHVILKDMPYFHLKLEPLADLANCFMPYVPGIKAYGPPASNVSAQNDVSFVFLIVLS
jgi:hypothetical protein